MKPLDIRPVAEAELLVTWEDGHRSLYAYDYLRLNCPCARCVEEWTGRRLIGLDKIAKGIHPLTTEPVGNYALRFDWSDGHQTGIYGFDFLRKICPCLDCRKADKFSPGP